MAMPESTPRRPGKPGQNRDSRDGVFGHPESQVGPLPRVGLYARVSTPHQHTIGMQLRQLREFLERRRWQEVLVVEEVASGSRRRPERDRLLSGPAASLRVIFHTVAAQAPGRPNTLPGPPVPSGAILAQESGYPQFPVIRGSYPRPFTKTPLRAISTIHQDTSQNLRPFTKTLM